MNGKFSTPSTGIVAGHDQVAVLFLEKKETKKDYDIFMSDVKWCGLPEIYRRVRRPALLLARVLINRACCVRLPQGPLAIP